MNRRFLPFLFAAVAISVGPTAFAGDGETGFPKPGLWQIHDGDFGTLRRELGPVMGFCGSKTSVSRTSEIDGVSSTWHGGDQWLYGGEIYLQAGTTYSFGSYIDDFCDIAIDGKTIHSQPSYQFAASQYVCEQTGWHSILITIWDNDGAYGNVPAWPVGIAYNISGQSSQTPESGWTQLIDPGDGTLFRVTKKPGSYLEMLLGESSSASGVSVQNVVCAQRYPWNGMVDIDYEVECSDPDADVWVYCTGYDGDMNVSMAPRTITGDGTVGPVKAGRHRMTWNVTADYPGFASTAFTVKMCALVGGAPYMVVDLSGGVDALSYPVSYLDSVPEGGWTDEYKGDKLVLRLIPPGTFLMGSPTDELGRNIGYSETQHMVMLTKSFYIGVFELTQKQWFNVMGTTKEGRKTGDFIPATGVSYNDIRGTVNGAAWPTHNQVDANSFMGRLRSKANMMFDLPTESQWEYACRAGTGTALNNGKNLTAREKHCDNLDEVAWYYSRSGFVPTTVGNYLPNVWGLYDMHGNACEWCLDWLMSDWGSSWRVDPKGPSSGQSGFRAVRGGGHYSSATSSWGPQSCRSAVRMGNGPDSNNNNGELLGFRVACFPAD